MFTFTTIGLSVSPRRITDSCMGIPSGKSYWPAQSYENRTGRAMSGRRSTPNVWLIFWPRSKRISKVQDVQCSTCGSVSKAKLKEQSVVISPHPPRKSRPVRNVTRWMEQESDWVLVQKKE